MEFQAKVNWPELPTKRINYDPSVMRSLPETNLTLRWVTHSYRYFNHCSDELYHQMSLRKSLVLKARNFIEKCKISFVEKFSEVSITLMYLKSSFAKLFSKSFWTYYWQNCVWKLIQCFSFHQSNFLKLQLDINKISVVGVHVRRGDKLRPEYQGPNQGYRIPEAAEILYAMNYMRLRHNHSVIFIMATDDKVVY